MNTLLTFIDSFRGQHYIIMNYELLIMNLINSES